MIEEIKELMFQLLKNDDSGHGMDHIKRVLDLSLQFAEGEDADLTEVSLIALLHDVDDYKLFGLDNAENLYNARRIMETVQVAEEVQERVLMEIGRIGYNKLLRGIRPLTIEGQIVSDADMCDALGANGILRNYAYSYKSQKPFFDKDIWPLENMTADEYKSRVADTSVCHIFEKILKLKALMMTKAGQIEAFARHEFVVEFLRNIFWEEKAYDWINYLNDYEKK